MDTMQADSSFILNNYLPKNLICDISLIDEVYSDYNDFFSEPLSEQLNHRDYINYNSNYINNCIKTFSNNANLSTLSTQSNKSCHSNSPNAASPSCQNINQRILLQPLINEFIRHNHNINIFNRLQPLINLTKERIIKTESKTKCQVNTQNDKSIKSELKLSEFLKSQKGSRIYQRKLRKLTEPEIDELIENLKYEISGLLTNVYGNYFCQKLYTNCNSNQRRVFLESIKNDIETVATDYCGSQALQGLLSQINSREEENIIKILFNREILLRLSLDQYGSFIVQKIYKIYDDVDQENLTNMIIDNLDSFMRTLNGFKMLKIFIALFNENGQTNLINKINNNILQYAQCEVGNYIIQYILKTLNPNSKCLKELITVILKNIIKLSVNKFSSNIIIRLMENFEKLRGRAINELFHNAKLYMITKNKYGIIVIQTFIRYLNPTDKSEISGVIVKRFNKNEHTVKEYEKLLIILDLLK